MKMKTAGQEALRFLPNSHSNDVETLENLLKRFAKMHVIAALNAVVETDKTSWAASAETRKRKLLESYPLTNIK
jgi:hypothetical protein